MTATSCHQPQGPPQLPSSVKATLPGSPPSHRLWTAGILGPGVPAQRGTCLPSGLCSRVPVRAASQQHLQLVFTIGGKEMAKIGCKEKSQVGVSFENEVRSKPGQHGSYMGCAHRSYVRYAHRSYMGSAHGSYVGCAHGSYVRSAHGSYMGSLHGSYVGSAHGSYVESARGSYVESAHGSYVGSAHGSEQEVVQSLGELEPAFLSGSWSPTLVLWGPCASEFLLT